MSAAEGGCVGVGVGIGVGDDGEGEGERDADADADGVATMMAASLTSGLGFVSFNGEGGLS